MFRKLMIVFLSGMLLLTACSGTLPGIESPSTEPAQNPGGSSTPDEPVSSNQPGQDVPAGEPWSPRPGDDALQHGEVEIESADMLILESYPPQFMLHLVGWKGTPCHDLRIVVSEPDEQNRIHVEAYTVVDPDVICIQMLEGFDVNVPLGAFESGEYTVWLNGTQIGEIAH